MTSGESHIAPPLIVAEGLDVTFYRSEDELLAHLEPWYPSTADYLAFDSRGRRLELYADPEVVPRRLIGPIWTDNAHESNLYMRAVESEPSGADELAQLLRELLRRVGEAREASKATLDQLLSAGIDQVGFTPRKPMRKRSRWRAR